MTCCNITTPLEGPCSGLCGDGDGEPDEQVETAEASEASDEAQSSSVDSPVSFH